MKTRGHLAALALFSLLFFSCREAAIVHDLEERDANEIVVLLARHDITAGKKSVEKNQEVTWYIEVSPGDAATARALLVANNLPKIRHGGLSGICKDAGLILTPKTEKCREILAYKGEIINSLESIPGVVSADVVLNIPDPDEFPAENAPTPRPTAAVTIQYLKDRHVATTLAEGKVQEFVANAVNGLDARDVTVILSYITADVSGATEEETRDEGTTATSDEGRGDEGTRDEGRGNEGTVETPELKAVGGLKMNEESARRFKLVAVMFLSLFLLLTAAFILVLLKLAKAKKLAATTALKPVESDVNEAERKLLKA